MAEITATAPVNPARSIGVDGLRLVLALMVIGLHGHFLSDIDARMGYLLEQGLFRIAVPVFLVISGYYLEALDAPRFGRWLRRIILLYLVWMAAYSAYWWPGARHAPGLIAWRLAFGYAHLWYLVALPLAAALLFALRGWPTRRLGALVLLLAALGLALQYAGSYHLAAGDLDHITNQVDLYRNFLFVGFPFLTIGFLLARHERDIQLSGAELAAALVLAVILLLVESSLNLRFAPRRETFDLLLSLYPLAPLLFLVARSMTLAGPGKEIALFATAIYLVHVHVLRQLDLHTTLSPTPKVLVTALVSMALAAVLMQVNRRLPVL